ncbi:hypothetical protein H5410_033071 [Solanum commersonii]|uniref:Uncharacterized protein n=1 Tax=Solanum commersonii TaxID=4109 RepID=A0A9J5YP29_SOLCO|nr:hypothetical protein H5410_033071 [Solanum commersonii]
MAVKADVFYIFSLYEQAFDKFTILNLSFSESLLQTPIFCETPNLQKIILKSCVSLVDIHPSMEI